MTDVERRSVNPSDSTEVEWCPVCSVSPVVLVALRHEVMRRWTEELLSAEHGCWAATKPARGELLADAIARTWPDLVIVDEVDFPACCRAALDRLPPDRVIVIGPEPDAAYETLARSRGAGGWVCRDHVAQELSAAMRAAMGCRHEPCPPRFSPAASAATLMSPTGGVFP